MSNFEITLLGLVAVSLGLAAWALKYGLKERRRRKGRPLFDGDALPEVNPQDVDDIFSETETGTALSAEAIVLGEQGSQASTTIDEVWVLAALAKKSKTIFEFGTCTGRTTYLLARNAPEGARIGTITLTPDTLDTYRAESDDPDNARWTQIAKEESTFTNFHYSGTPVEGKVEQFFGDSKEFDDTPWAGTCDLVFIDGSHAYSYVKSDTEKAIAMTKKGGLVFWHDYSPPCPGVWKYLNELGKTHPIKHIKGTRLAVLRVS
ncbi:MAG: class I SAM-dependent methyltransferase [Rhodobiaceae bacterium]|nr:class I SAM-dependent methyltransferase [Rhodobiaceae bacterium]